MANTTPRIARLVAQVVEVALGNNPKRPDGPEHPGLGAVDLANAVTLSDRATFGPTRQVEIPGERVARVAVLVATAFVAPTTTAETAIPGLAPVAIIDFEDRICPTWAIAL
jgi:hypothetical protein